MQDMAKSLFREMRRQRADWMNPVDDQIMEILKESGAGTPNSLAQEMGKNNDYLGRRCRELASYGLLDRPSRGLYILTDLGEEYLEGELDANELDAE
jgi:predicted transcriptional regulator